MALSGFIGLVSFNLSGQNTVVEGNVKDALSNEKITYANIYFKGSNVGTISDTSGYFYLSTDQLFDSISFKVLGYETKTIPIKIGQKQVMEVNLKSDMYHLSEVSIVPGENPAWAILRKVIAHKDLNGPDSKKSYHYQEYSKIQFDLNHFTEKIQNNIILRPFDFIWEHVDSTDDGVAYLPILLIENLSEHYYRKKGNKSKEIVHGRQATGLEGPKIMKFVQDMYINPNFYNNYVEILEKNFPSPLSDNYKTNYRFYLTDSIKIDGEFYYQIIFKPKAFNAQAFDGQMYIHKGSYALKEISLRFDIRANVNFVRSYWVKQVFEAIDGENWMMTGSNVLGDFTVLENQSEMTGFFGRKSTSIRDLEVNIEIPDSVFHGVDNLYNIAGSDERENQFWVDHRHDTLSQSEKDIYKMVAEIEDHPAFIFRKNLANAIWNGYYPKKYIDLGDIYTYYSYNQVEYSRFKFAFRTNENLMPNTSLNLFGAYGTKDDAFKYGGGLEHKFKGKSNHFLKLGGFYKYDIEQLGWSYNFIPIDHVIASLIQINLSDTRTYNERGEVYVERQWFTGFNTRITAFSHVVSPNQDMSFQVMQDTSVSVVDQFSKGGIKFSMRYAKGEDNTDGDYYSPTHRWVKNAMPIISFEYAGGLRGVLGSEFNFHELKMRFDQRVKIKKWGYTNYLLEAGKIWGTMPYHFLQIPFANEVVINDKIAYNLMNYLEFINDEFVQFQLEHHFEGLLLGNLPLIKKTKLRSFVLGKVYAGNIREENNNAQYLFAEGSNKMSEVYYELGFGIENILKIARIDVIWRMNYLNNENVYPFIIKPSFQFNF